MLSILKNDWDRLMVEKKSLIFSEVLIVLSVLLAVFLTRKMQTTVNLAVVGGNHSIESQGNYKVIELTEQPSVLSLIEQKYDAIVVYQEDGSYEIQSERSEEFIKGVDFFLKGEFVNDTETTKTRKIGTNIIGYMVMFLLMEGISYGKFFVEDKEKHQMERIVSSPISFFKYLGGHGIFMWFIVFLPSFLVILVVDLFGINIGFTLGQYAILLGILCTFAVCFSIFIGSFCKVYELANMLGNTIIVLTSILAGSFYDMTDSNRFFGKLLYALPQKGFMQFMNALENQSLDRASFFELSYVILITIVMLVIGVVKTRKDYIYQRG